MTNLISPYLLCTLCINHTPITPPTKTIKARVYSATNPTIFPRKLKMPPTTLPTIAGNASVAFPTSLLSASPSLSNHFFKNPSSFAGEPHASPTSPKTPVAASTIVEIVIERAVSIKNMVIPYSRNKVRTLSARDVSLSRIFSRVYLIRATYV